MSKHTPGPWRIEAYNVTSPDEITPTCDWTIYGPNGESVCFEGDTNDSAKYNARLIAAAPDLLEALKALADYVDDRTGDNEYCPLENARAAIAKATEDQ